MDEAPEGGDARDVLREIAAALPMEAAAPVPEAPAPAVPEVPAPASEEPARPLSSRALPRPTWWAARRHELAGLVTAFVALVWMSLGVASRDWGPVLIGVTFALGALFIGARASWAGD
jgi:hypothetical protein